MRKGEIRPRRVGGRSQRRTILIVCEGEKTEPLYFAHFREALRGKAAIKIQSPNAKDPEGLVHYARVQRDRLNIDTKGKDRIWIVFDADENSQDQVNAGLAAAKSARAELAISVPCFEIWFLLHFENRKTPITGTETFHRVLNFIPNYDKSLDVYDKLAEGQAVAMERAKSLEQIHGDRLRIDRNPGTDVWRILQDFAADPS